jgi:predicted RNase H-like HicB family nuclease
MPTRTYTVVLERADTETRQYTARVPCLDPTGQYFTASGRSPEEALKRVKEAIVTGLAALSQEPDFHDYPLDRPKPRLLKVEVALPVPLRAIIDTIVPAAPPSDNVTPFKPRR